MYTNAMIDEWVARGYKNNMAHLPHGIDPVFPWWWGWEPLIQSHRASLNRKMPSYYSFDVGDYINYGYIWPKETESGTERQGAKFPSVVSDRGVDSKPKHTAMASATSFVSTVQSLVAARDLQFLERVAQDYKLDLAELTAKFLEVPPAAAEEKKKKRAIKIRLTSDGKEIRCQGFTAKKEQCSFGPLPGQCFCKRHLPASAAPEVPEEAPELRSTPSALLSPIPEAPEAPGEPFTVAEEDKVGFEDLSPLMALAPSKSLESSSHEGTPCNLWAKLEEVQAEADQEELDRELTRRQALEKEHEDMLAALRKQEEEEAEPEPAPYEPPANSPSPPKKASKRRQSIRPKVTKK